MCPYRKQKQNNSLYKRRKDQRLLKIFRFSNPSRNCKKQRGKREVNRKGDGEGEGEKKGRRREEEKRRRGKGGERERERERASAGAKPCRSNITFLKDFLNLNFADKVGNRGNVDSV